MLNEMPDLKFFITTGSVFNTQLLYSPQGWDDSLVQYERSLKYYGVFRSFTVPMRFAKDGAQYLRQEFYTYKLDSIAYILIQKLNRITLVYETAYQGSFDFSTFKDTDYQVEITVIDGGLAQLFKNNETTQYKIPNRKPYYEAWVYGVETVDAQIGYIHGGAFTAPSMHLMSLFNWLCDKMTGGKVQDSTYAVRSDFLSGPIGEKVLATISSSWNGIYDESTQYFNTTIADFFNSINAIWPVGIGIENWEGTETIVLETREYFFSKSNTIDTLDIDVKNLSISLVKEWMFNKLKIGFQEKNYSDESVRLTEPNTFSNYLVKNSKISGVEVDMTCKYRADGAGLDEYMDSGPYNNSSADIFLVEVYPDLGHDGIYIRSPAFVRKKDIPATEYDTWSMLLSPAQSAARHLQWISDFLCGTSNFSLQFISGGNDQDNNETKDGNTGAWVEEYDDIALLPIAYVYPYQIEFEAPYKSNLFSLIQQNPYGLITFDYMGNTYTGYLKKIEVKLPGRGATKYTLIACAENDFSTLINNRV